MAITTPTTIDGDINVGQDLSITFSAQGAGGQFQAASLSEVTSFTAKSEDQRIRYTPISNRGRRKTMSVPQGWTGTIKFGRTHGGVTDLAAQLSDNFFQGRLLQKYDIFCTIVNRDGSTDQYQFQNCTIFGFGFGHFEANKEVEQELEFDAEYMRRV